MGVGRDADCAPWSDLGGLVSWGGGALEKEGDDYELFPLVPLESLTCSDDNSENTRHQYNRGNTRASLLEREADGRPNQ